MRKTTTAEFVAKAATVHAGKYDYTKSAYRGSWIPVEIYCPSHGPFEQSPHAHLKGAGCPACAHNYKHTTESFIAAAIRIHDKKYDYSQVQYRDNKTPVTITCPSHGPFEQTPNMHLRKRGCKTCGYQRISADMMDDRNIFITKATTLHAEKYDYSAVTYTQSKRAVTIICPTHGAFEQLPNGHLTGRGCPACSCAGTSKGEREVGDWLSAATPHPIVKHDRTTIAPYELDIYIPEKKLAIEYCGLFWHSFEMLTRRPMSANEARAYHKKKHDLCAARDIRLITIFEDEWLHHEPLVKSRVAHAMGDTGIKLSARNLTVRTISSTEAKMFLDEHHLQGNLRSAHRYALCADADIIAVMTFGKARYKQAEWELLRFTTAADTSITGGAAKLFTHFVKDHSPISVVSFCDLRWGTGAVYERLGFQLSHVSQPAAWYFQTANIIRKNRLNFQKHKLPDTLPVYDATLSSAENIQQAGFHSIYDCGNAVFIWSSTSCR